MTLLTALADRFPIFRAERPRNPWGGSGGGGNNGSGDEPTPAPKPDGPRNPWTPPSGTPSGAQAPGPSALDQLLKRAGGGGGGGGGGGPRRPAIPGAPSPRTLWGVGAALIVLAWLLLTSVHPIGPQQRGVVTVLGRYAGILDPGIRLTLPLPFAQVDKVDVSEIHSDNFPTSAGTENLMLTGDQNVVNVGYSVRWDIVDPQNYVFQIRQPEETVRDTAESAMRAIVATTTLDEVIGEGRGALGSRAQILMQRILDSYRSGVRIRSVAIRTSQQPEAVAEAFNAVTAAQQNAQSAINQSRGYASSVISRAQGEAASFDRIYAQYRLAPDVTRRRMYYDTMDQVLSHSDRTVLNAQGAVTYLPLPGGRTEPDPQPSPTPTGAAQ